MTIFGKILNCCKHRFNLLNPAKQDIKAMQATGDTNVELQTVNAANPASGGPTRGPSDGVSSPKSHSKAVGATNHINDDNISDRTRSNSGSNAGSPSALIQSVMTMNQTSKQQGQQTQRNFQTTDHELAILSFNWDDPEADSKLGEIIKDISDQYKLMFVLGNGFGGVVWKAKPLMIQQGPSQQSNDYLKLNMSVLANQGGPGSNSPQQQHSIRKLNDNMIDSDHTDVDSGLESDTNTQYKSCHGRSGGPGSPQTEIDSNTDIDSQNRGQQSSSQQQNPNDDSHRSVAAKLFKRPESCGDPSSQSGRNVGAFESHLNAQAEQNFMKRFYTELKMHTRAYNRPYFRKLMFQKLSANVDYYKMYKNKSLPDSPASTSSKSKSKISSAQKAQLSALHLEIANLTAQIMEQNEILDKQQKSESKTKSDSKNTNISKKTDKSDSKKEDQQRDSTNTVESTDGITISETNDHEINITIDDVEPESVRKEVFKQSKSIMKSCDSISSGATNVTNTSNTVAKSVTLGPDVGQTKSEAQEAQNQLSQNQILTSKQIEDKIQQYSIKSKFVSEIVNAGIINNSPAIIMRYYRRGNVASNLLMFKVMPGVKKDASVLFGAKQQLRAVGNSGTSSTTRGSGSGSKQLQGSNSPGSRSGSGSLAKSALASAKTPDQRLELRQNKEDKYGCNIDKHRITSLSTAHVAEQGAGKRTARNAIGIYSNRGNSNTGSTAVQTTNDSHTTHTDSKSGTVTGLSLTDLNQAQAQGLINYHNLNHLARQLLLGLIELHLTCHMWHNDIKPENIMLQQVTKQSQSKSLQSTERTSSFQIKWIDFGLCKSEREMKILEGTALEQNRIRDEKEAEQAQQSQSDHDTTNSKSKGQKTKKAQGGYTSTYGTIVYCAPEIRDPNDNRIASLGADSWSIGTVLIECIFGERSSSYMWVIDKFHKNLEKVKKYEQIQKEIEKELELENTLNRQSDNSQSGQNNNNSGSVTVSGTVTGSTSTNQQKKTKKSRLQAKYGHLSSTFNILEIVEADILQQLGMDTMAHSSSTKSGKNKSSRNSNFTSDIDKVSKLSRHYKEKSFIEKKSNTNFYLDFITGTQDAENQIGQEAQGADLIDDYNNNMPIWGSGGSNMHGTNASISASETAAKQVMQELNIIQQLDPCLVRLLHYLLDMESEKRFGYSREKDIEILRIWKYGADRSMYKFLGENFWKEIPFI